MLLAKFLGVPADPSQVHYDRGQGDEPYTLEHLSRIAKKLGLISRLRDAKREELGKMPLTVIVRTKDGGAFILLQIDEEGQNPRYMIQRGDEYRAPAFGSAAVQSHRHGRGRRD